MTVNIPEYLEMQDIHIGRIITYKFVQRVNNTIFLYENIKTGCKECFSIYDLVEFKNEKKQTTKYESKKQNFKEG